VAALIEGQRVLAVCAMAGGAIALAVLSHFV
jgi:hypothetical protein